MTLFKSKKQKLEEKFAKIQELLNVSSNPNTHTEEILPEPDQHILQLVDEVGQVSAKDVMERLAYKKSNAASQRLSKLVREGHLLRVRSGRKVYFMRQHPTPNV